MAADPFTKRAALSAYLPALLQYRSGRRPDGLPLAMAKLWERWKDRASGDTTLTFTIITTVPTSSAVPFMVVCPSSLPREKWATWLGERGEPGRAAVGDPAALPGRIDAGLSVDVRVGNVRNNDAAFLDEISLVA